MQSFVKGIKLSRNVPGTSPSSEPVTRIIYSSNASSAGHVGDKPVIILGDRQPGGVYLLRLRIHRPLTVACGRFNRGRPLFFPPGDYVYVGSALGSRGATLANRLVRHATRTADRPPHALRATLLESGHELGLGSDRTSRLRPKKLFWHIDYVLDEMAVELCGIIALRTTARLEARWAQWLNAAPWSFVVAKGLGASDHHGATHLLGVHGDEAWWAELAEWIRGNNGRAEFAT